MARIKNADLVAIIRNLEAQLAALTVPAAQTSMDAIASTLADACSACDGTGLHSSGGECFRCQGKGHQDASDVKRNAVYDRCRAARPQYAAEEGYAHLADIPAALRRGKIIRLDGLFYLAK